MVVFFVVVEMSDTVACSRRCGGAGWGASPRLSLRVAELGGEEGGQQAVGCAGPARLPPSAAAVKHTSKALCYVWNEWVVGAIA